MRVLILIAYLLHVAYAAPQFVTFKDGKIGVNFGGYHADAGLGGLLTGNAAHGGLSASAGTPWGPKAAAGLGGSVDGRTAGVAYAGAEANPSVGASALLGGSAGERGFIGSEAHANGNVAVRSLYNPAVQYSEVVTSGPVPVVEHSSISTIQRIKPPKKYKLIRDEQPVSADVNVVHSKHVVKSVQTPVATAVRFDAPAPPAQRFEVSGGNTVFNALQIPIGILRSLQESLGGLSVAKSLSVETSG